MQKIYTALIALLIVSTLVGCSSSSTSDSDTNIEKEEINSLMEKVNGRKMSFSQ